MFEGQVQKLLLDYLGIYVKDFQKEQLKVGLWNGQVLLENVELIPEAFDYLQLPLALKQGRVGRLSITIPWKKLGWDPIIIVLEDVFIHACRRYDHEWSSDSVERREYAGKKAKLAAAELAKLSRRVCKNQAGQSFISYITAKILDGIQLSVRNVHVVYTDEQNDSEHFVFGLKFSSLTMKQNPTGSINAKPRGGQVNKIIKVSNLAIYCHPAHGTLHSTNGDSSFHARLECKEVDYILAPFNVDVSLVVNRSGKLEHSAPQYSISGELHKLVLSLNEIQMHHILVLWDYLSTGHLRERYGRYRPWVCPLLRKQKGWQSMWWHYAQESVLSDVRKKLKKTSWRYLGWRMSYRRKYVNLYKKKLDILRQEQPVDKDILRELEWMERESDIDDILSYRSIAEQEFQEFNLTLTSPNVGKNGGWLNWISRGMLGAGGTEDSIQFSGAVSDEVVKDIYESTEFNPESSVDRDLFTKSGIYLSSIKFNIHQITAKLQSKTCDMDIVEVILEEVFTECKLWEESWNMLFLVNSVEMDDMYTKQTIVHTQKAISEEKLQKSVRPFVTFEVKSPVNRDSELSLKVVLQPFVITHDSGFLLHLCDFYHILGSFQFQRQRVLLSLNEFEDVNTRLLSKAGFILSNRTEIAWDVHFSSITIKIPPGQDDIKSFLVLEVGNFILRSSNRKESSASEREGQIDSLFTNFMWSKSVTDMPHVLHLEDLYAHYDIVLKTCEVNIIQPDSHQTIPVLERFNASISLASCILDESTLKRFKVCCSISPLSLHLSSSIYGIIVGTVACLDIPKSNSQISVQRKQNADGALQFSLTANLESVNFHLDLADDGQSSFILALVFGELNLQYDVQENVQCRVSIKTFTVGTHTSKGEEDSYEKSGSAKGCFLLHYKAGRNVGTSFHHYVIYLSDVDIHLYPTIIGLILKFYDRISSYGIPSDPSCKNSFGSTKEMKNTIPSDGLGLQTVGFSNFQNAESTVLAGVPLDHFPFLTIHNSQSLGCLEESLVHGIPKWRKTSVKDRKPIRSQEFNVKKGSKMFGMSTLEPTSGVSAFLASGDCHDVDLLVIDLNLNGSRVHFHDSSCVVGMLTIPISKSIIIVNHMDCWDFLCSIEGLHFSSPWSNQDYSEYLWGNSVPSLSPILNIRLRKVDDGAVSPKLDISFGIQHSCCVLPSEFLAILIGYFSLPDWASNTTEQFDTGNHGKDDMKDNNSCITYKFEILESILVLPVEGNKNQFLHLDLQQLYCSFTPRSRFDDGLKHIPPECTVPTQKISDVVHLLNMFGQDIYLSLIVLKNDQDVSVKLDMTTRHESIYLVAPLDADLWIRIPCEGKGSCGLSASTCIMMKVHNCQVTAEDDYFVPGVEAFLNVINQLSSVGEESRGFKSDVSQFMQLKRNFEEEISVSSDALNAAFAEVRCCVNLLSLKFYGSQCVQSDVVIKVDMQLQISASFRNETPIVLDIGFSRLSIHSFQSDAVLVQCVSESSVSYVLDIHLTKSDQGVNELLVRLPCSHIWLHMSEWIDFLDILHSYSRQFATFSFMTASLKQSGSVAVELAPSVIPVFQNISECPSTLDFDTSNMVENSVDLVVKSDCICLSFHFPIVTNNKAFDKFRVSEVKQEVPSYFSSARVGEEAMLLAKQSDYVAVILESRDSQLVISGRDMDMQISVEKVRGILESVCDQRVLSWPFFQLFNLHVLGKVSDTNTCIEVEVNNLDVWLSHHLFYFWYSLANKITETGSSEFSLSNVDLKVKLKKGSMLLTDGRWSCSGPLLELVLKNLSVHSAESDSTMTVLIASDFLVNYSNIQKVMWEPFIETWNFQLNVIRKHKKSAFPNACAVTDIDLTSTVPLNLNLTEPLFEVISRVTELIKEVNDQAGLDDPPESHWFLGCQTLDSVYTRRYAPYLVQNETSLPLLFQVYRGLVSADDIDILAVKEGNIVHPGSYVPIYIDETVEEQVLRFRPTQSLDRLNEKRLTAVAHHMISIQLEGTSELSAPVSMDMVGLSYFEVNFSNASEKVEIEKSEDSRYNRNFEEKRITNSSGFVVPVVIDVSIQRYSKLIRLYSTVKLLNATSMPLELRFDIPFGVSPKVLDPIYPGQEFPLPLLLAEAGRLRWRPLGNDFLWSEAHMLSNILSQENMVGFVRSFICYPSHPSSDSFRCCISVRHVTLPSCSGRKKGPSSHIKDTVGQSTKDSSQRLYIVEKSKIPYIHYVTLTTPLLVKNYLPVKLSLLIESGGITRTVLISEADSASVFHIDSTHELGLVFHVLGFNPSSAKFPRAETFTAMARFDETKFTLSETLILYSDSSPGSICVNLEKVMDAFCGAREICIFSPFLLYNCTGLPLTVAESSNVKSGNCCYIPSCYHLINMDKLLGGKHGLSLVSLKQESYDSIQGIDIWNSSAKSNPISMSKEVNLHLHSSPSKRSVATECSRCSMEKIDHYIDSDEASFSNLNCKPCTSTKRPFSEKGDKDDQVLNLDGRKVKACMYSPISSSYASDLMVRLSLCHPECRTENIEDSLWSSPFFLVPESGSTNVIVPQAFASGAFMISVTSSPLAGPYSGRTRAITFQPRYVICNACSKDLSYKQKGTGSVFHLGVGKHSHLYLADTTRELLVSLRFNEPGWLWSGSFFPDHLGDTQVKMRNYVCGALNMIRVEVQNADVSITDEKIVGSPHGNSGTHLILLSDDNTGFMPYRIDNFSTEMLRIYQQKCESFETTIHSYTACPYAWDEPCYPHRLVVEVLGKRILGSYTLDEVKECLPVYLPSTSEKPGRHLLLSIHAEGTIKVLSVVDSSFHLLKDTKQSGFAGFRERKKIDQKEDILVEYSERISIHVPFVGVSLIKSYPQPEELLFLSATETKVELLQSVEQQKLAFQISSLQIDNQLRNTPYPVILSFDNDHGGGISAGQVRNKDDSSKIQTETLVHITSERSCEPIFFLAAAKWRKKEVSLVSFEYITIRLAALRLELEEELLLCLFDFVRTVISRMQSKTFPWEGSNGHRPARVQDDVSLDINRGYIYSMNVSRYQEVFQDNLSLPSVVPIGAPWQQIYLLARRQKKVYVEVFDLAPIKLTLSFSSAPWMLRNERPASAESLGPVSSTAFQRGLISLADIEEAPVYLKQLTITHHMGSWESFQEILIRHYTRKLLHEMYKVFGSAGVIGNPMGFARNLGLGIRDFLSAPARGILQSPAGLFTGMVQGTSSLVSNTVYAISNATTQFSKSAHKSIVAFTFDDQAVSKVEKQQKGLAAHSKGVLNEFLEGLTGFLQSPVRGAEKHGLPGVLSGIALGTAGLVARPVASILDVTGKTAQSIRNRSSLHRPNRFRSRFPRPLTRGLPLQPYSWEEAIGTSMLLEADDAKFKDEILVMCKALKQLGKFVIVTERLLLVVMCSSLVGLGTAEFHGVADPEWVIEVEMGLETVIHVGREVEVLTIVGSSLETLPKHKRSTPRTSWRSHSSALPIFQISIELAKEEEAEKVVQVLLSAIEQGNMQGWGVHVLRRSALR